MTTINEFLINVPNSQKAELERIRRVVRESVPEAEEVFSYGIPGFKYNGKYLVGFCAYKDHLSLFPTSRPIMELRDKLKRYKLAKGTIQFTLDNPIPDELIKEIVLSRAADISA